MLISTLFDEPIEFLAWAISFIICLSVHEFAHAYAAFKLGDDTAEQEGRLTLNPLSHLDIFGTITLLFIGFGWGKPVPYNPYNLKDRKWGGALISLAGPLSNFLMGVLGIIVFKFLLPFLQIPPNNMLVVFIYIFTILNFALMAFNLIPIPPLDGSKLLFAILPAKYNYIEDYLQKYGFVILLFLIIIQNGSGHSFISLLLKFVYSTVNRVLFL